MRISDWSSDVCSSDLDYDAHEGGHHHQDGRRKRDDRQQNDELDDAPGRRAAVAEVEIDALRQRRRSAEDERIKEDQRRNGRIEQGRKATRSPSVGSEPEDHVLSARSSMRVSASRGAAMQVSITLSE